MAPQFLNLALDEAELSASSHVGPLAGLSTVEMRESLLVAPAWNQTLTLKPVDVLTKLSLHWDTCHRSDRC
jgi:hypothetical protein